jgi:protein involved in polysaccharide export with SLBB domain
MNQRTNILFSLLAASLLLLQPGCSILNSKSSPPVITAGKNQPAPSPLTSKLRDNFGVREVSPSVATPSVAPSTAQPLATAVVSNASVGPYKMRSGDTILITVRVPGSVRNDPAQEDVIDDSGMVNFPLIGRMLARGKTTSEFEQEVERAYIDGKFYKQVTVNVVIPQRFVFVTGEVRQSGKFPLVAGLTLYGAISSAGGPNEYADQKKVQLMRGGRPAIHNLIEIQKDPTKDVPLEAGDQIVVPRSWY